MGATGESVAAPDERRQLTRRGRPTATRSSTRRSSFRPLRPPGDERALGDRRRQRQDAQALRGPRRHPARRLSTRPSYRLLGPAGRRRQRDIWTMPVKGLAAGEAARAGHAGRGHRLEPGLGAGRQDALLPLQSRRRDEPLAGPDRRGDGPDPRAPPSRRSCRRGRSAASRSPGTGARSPTSSGRPRISIDRLVFDARPDRLTGKPEQILGSSQEIVGLRRLARRKAHRVRLSWERPGRPLPRRHRRPELRQLTDDAPKDRARRSFSPDGKRLAFHSDRAGGRYEIWTSRGRQRPEAPDSGKGPHHRASLVVRTAAPSPPTAAAQARSSSSTRRAPHPRRAHPAADPGDVLLSRSRGRPTGRRLAGSLLRLRDSHRAVVSPTIRPATGAAVRPVPGTERWHAPVARRVSRRSLLLYVDRDLHVTDLSSGETASSSSVRRTGTSRASRASRAATTCYVVRSERQRRHLDAHVARSRPRNDARRRFAGSAPTRSSARSAPAGWARSTGRRIRGSGARSRSRCCRRRSRRTPTACAASSRRRRPRASSTIPTSRPSTTSGSTTARPTSSRSCSRARRCARARGRALLAAQGHRLRDADRAAASPPRTTRASSTAT